MSSAALKKAVESFEKKYGGLRTLDAEDPLDQILLLVLSRGVGEKKARQALKNLHDTFVDWNEIRVSEVYEIEEAVSVLGKRGLTARALALKEVLAAVYSRFNRMSLAFMLEDKERPTARAIEKLQKFLGEVSPAVAMLMECFFAKKSLVVRAPVPRLMVDEKLAPKGATTATARKLLESHLDSEEQLLMLWGLFSLHEEAEAAKLAEKEKKEQARLEVKRRQDEAKEKKKAEAERKLRDRELARQKKIIEKEAKRRAAERAKESEAKKKAAAKKKAEAKQLAAKKAAEKKAAKKAASKKAAPKKAAAKKTTKKAASKKAAAKKVTAKKATKKAAPKKAAAKKTATKKTAKKAAPKKTAKKKVVAKKATKKTVKKAAKKAPAKKATKKAATKKKSTRRR